MTLKNSPFWNTHLVYCEDVVIQNVRFENPSNAPNTDGLEKLWIEKPNIRFIGEGADKTIINYDDAAFHRLPNGERRGTFRSYSVFIGADDVTAEGLTFANSAGKGDVVGQAPAALRPAQSISVALAALCPCCIFELLDGNAYQIGRLA